MTIQVDRGKCEGFGFCEEAAPDVFELDDEGYVVLKDPSAVEARRDVVSAIRACPVGALLRST